MTEIVAVGGFGSTLKQYESLADKLHQKFGPDLAISGVNFLSALKHTERLADDIDGKYVITHSAGAYAVAAAVEMGAMPAQLDMLAPPSYDMTHRLVMNGLRYELTDRRQRELDATNRIHERGEILRHPQAHIGVILALGKFATMPFGAACQQCGIMTRIGVMASDGIFEFSQYPVEEIQKANNAGVKVSMIEGNHTRFTRDPGAVLDELETNSVVEIDHRFNNVPVVSLSATMLGKLAMISNRAALSRRVA